jgi:hypothetical protein
MILRHCIKEVSHSNLGGLAANLHCQSRERASARLAKDADHRCSNLRFGTGSPRFISFISVLVVVDHMIVFSLHRYQYRVQAPTHILINLLVSNQLAKNFIALPITPPVRAWPLTHTRLLQWIKIGWVARSNPLPTQSLYYRFIVNEIAGALPSWCYLPRGKLWK